MTQHTMHQHQISHTTHHAPLSVVTRRGALKISVGTALGALLNPATRSTLCAEDSPPATANDKAVILLWLNGGPHQHDSFDPKESNCELATKFKPIATTVPGMQFAECLPALAQQAKHLAVIRSMVGEEIEHNLAQYHVQTGWRNTGPIQAPAMGSIVAHELGPLAMQRASADGIPSYVSIAHEGYSCGYFGPAFQPVYVADPNRPPENLDLPPGITRDVFRERLEFLKALEKNRQTRFANQFRAGRQGAVAFMNSKNRVAFDLDKEAGDVRDAYGRNSLGQGCLLARRLVEAGVRFVQINQSGYDTHSNHYPAQENLLRDLDKSMSKLIVDLEQRGLLQDTVVIAAGEFGRTPKMNPNKGTDHWFNGYSLAVAGGGFQGGSIYGVTPPDGNGVSENPVTIPDFMATLMHAIGINPEKEYHDSFNRPIKLVDDGKILTDLML